MNRKMLFIILLMLVCATLGVWYWRKTKKKRYLFGSIGLITIALMAFPILMTVLFLGGGDISFARLFDKARIIELDKFDSFSGKTDDRRYYTVLVKDPPESADSLKKMMVRYFIDKAAYVDSTDTDAYLARVYFYKYTLKTAWFINHDEDPGGFSSNTLDMMMIRSAGLWHTGLVGMIQQKTVS